MGNETGHGNRESSGCCGLEDGHGKRTPLDGEVPLIDGGRVSSDRVQGGHGNDVQVRQEMHCDVGKRRKEDEQENQRPEGLCASSRV